MNRHILVPSSMRVLLALSLLLAFISIEQGAAPMVALAASPVSISAGNGHSCAVKSDNTTACWGDNTYGRVSQRPSARSPRSVRAGTISVA